MERGPHGRRSDGEVLDPGGYAQYMQGHNPNNPFVTGAMDATKLMDWTKTKVDEVTKVTTEVAESATGAQKADWKKKGDQPKRVKGGEPKPGRTPEAIAMEDPKNKEKWIKD